LARSPFHRSRAHNLRIPGGEPHVWSRPRAGHKAVAAQSRSRLLFPTLDRRGHPEPLLAVHERTSVGCRQTTSTLRAPGSGAVTSLHQFRGSYSSRSAPSRRLLQHAACFRSLETATPASTSGFGRSCPRARST